MAQHEYKFVEIPRSSILGKQNDFKKYNDVIGHSVMSIYLAFSRFQKIRNVEAYIWKLTYKRNNEK